MSRPCGHEGSQSRADPRLCPECLFALALEPDIVAAGDATAIRLPDDPSGEGADDGAARFTPGTTFAGRFRIVTLVARGGMGEVYRADDLKLGQPVALKFLAPSIENDAESLRRLHAEVRLGRQIAHPNVCRVHDIIEHDGRHCIAMEYVEGEDLASLLARVKRVPYRQALVIARDVSAALTASHRAGIVHGDLKPGNILIDGRGRAKITDFGLSRLADDASTLVAGTLAYMAPEQLDGAPATQASDLYALGLILYELFSGEKAREAESLAELRATAATPLPPLSPAAPAIDPDLEAAIVRCVDPRPEGRPSSAAEILAACPPGAALDAALALGETPTPEAVATAGDVRVLSPLAAALLFLLFLLLVFVPGIEVPPGPLRSAELPIALPSGGGVYLGLVVAILAAGAVLARRHLRAGRADHRGALRISAFVFVAWLLWWMLAASHTRGAAEELARISGALGDALFAAARVWLAYMALEPYVRRHRPAALVAWNRVLAGRFTDGLVARSLLVGAVGGALVRFLGEIRGELIPLPAAGSGSGGLAAAFGALFFLQTRAVFYGLMGLFLLVLLRFATRNGAAAGVTWVVLAALPWIPPSPTAIEAAATLLQMTVVLILLVRWGLLAAVATVWFHLILGAAAGAPPGAAALLTGAAAAAGAAAWIASSVRLERDPAARA